MANPQAAASPTKVVTEDTVRLAFTKNLWEKNKQGKYSLMLLIPKTDKVTMDKINGALESVKADPKSLAIWGGKIPVNLHSPVRDGDTERDVEERPEYKGHWFINANSQFQPGIVDANVQPILDRDEVYSGCYGRVSLTFLAYNHPEGGKGIMAGLNNVQKKREGEKLTGAASAQDDFGPVAANEEENFLG